MGYLIAFHFRNSYFVIGNPWFHLTISMANGDTWFVIEHFQRTTRRLYIYNLKAARHTKQLYTSPHAHQCPPSLPPPYCGSSSTKSMWRRFLILIILLHLFAWVHACYMHLFIISIVIKTYAIIMIHLCPPCWFLSEHIYMTRFTLLQLLCLTNITGMLLICQL